MFLALYRNETILEGLGFPLYNGPAEADEEENTTAGLFFISERSKEDFISMNEHSIEYLFDENKINLLNLPRYKNEMFANYCKSFIVDKEMVGKYLIGLETSMVFWLIDCFQQISQTKNYHSMHNHLCKIINKFC